jgi:hypothetical protein
MVSDAAIVHQRADEWLGRLVEIDREFPELPGRDAGSSNGRQGAATMVGGGENGALSTRVGHDPFGRSLAGIGGVGTLLQLLEERQPGFGRYTRTRRHGQGLPSHRHR